MHAAGPGRWVSDGECGRPGLDPAVREAFTADTRTPADPAAAAVCDRCAVLTDCARYAATIRYLTGIWGGRRRREDLHGVDARIIDRRAVSRPTTRSVQARPTPTR